MLDRIKKNLIYVCLGLMLTLPALALDSTVSYININNLAYKDVEIVLLKNEILVPFKQLADVFNIPYTANRVDKQIGFKTWDGKDAMITQQGVFIQDVAISKFKTEFLQQGIMDGVFNEAYITADVAAQIFGIKLSANIEDLSLEAQVERDIPILRLNNAVEDDNSPKAYQDVVTPKKPAKITLNTIGLRSSMLSDNVSVKGQDFHSINDTFTGTTQASINGKIFGGKYKVEATEFHYRSDAFMFGGVSGSYANSIKDENGKEEAWYQLGKISGMQTKDYSIGTNVFGGQIWNYDYDKEAPNDISGYVKPTSLVRLTVNDLEPVTLSTYAGYYSLKEIQLPNPVKYIKLEEVNEDGSVELIKEEKYSIYGKNVPFAQEHRGTAFAGVWGYQNRFFREGANIYRGNNKKVSAGIGYQYGIKDNVTFESKLTGDKLYEKNGSSVIYRMPTSDTLLVSGTQKSVNYLEGVTLLNNMNWISPNNENVKGRVVAGTSVAHDIREEHTHAGYIFKTEGEYEKDLTQYQTGIFKPKKVSGKLELFHSSPDFYVAASDSTSKNDRTGGKAIGSVSFNSTSAGGSYSRYYSNFNHRYQGGTIKFDEASINASTQVPKVAVFRFSSNYRRGENQLGRNKNYYYDANASRNIGHWATIQGGRRESVYDTRYDNPNSINRDYYTKFADNYAQVNIPIPGNHGIGTIGHSVVRYNSGNYQNGYNMFKFGYTFPTWKRLTLGVGYGFRYYGQGGKDFNVRLAYRAKSGQNMSVGYQYSENGGYFIDNMFMPTTNRHSVNFTFNDAFQLFHNGLKSVGDEDLNKGIFEAIAFVDVNKNGKYDKKIDIPIKDVPLITSWGGGTNLTNKSGRVYSSSLEQGLYTVSIDMNELPITVAPYTNDLISKKVKIDGGQTTRLEIPLISTVGSVSGTLKIFDDFDRNLKITDFVVVLLDENGEEVNYSTVDATGDFYISGLAPGRYTLKLDDNFVNAYGLEELPHKSAINVFIPYDYNTPIDFTEQNLEYKTLSL